jgi:hypothetical protein
VKVRGFRVPGGAVEGVAIAGDHAELVAIFETIVRGLPLGATAAPARELAIRCLAVLSRPGTAPLVDGLDGLDVAITVGDPDEEPEEPS